MSPQEQWDITLIRLLLELLHKIINISKGLLRSSSLSPLLLLGCTSSETTLIKGKCFYPLLTEFFENVVISINVFIKSMDENEVCNGRYRWLSRLESHATEG